MGWDPEDEGRGAWEKLPELAWHLTCACATRIAAVRCLPRYLRATWYYGIGEQINTKHAVEETRGLFFSKCVKINIFLYIIS
jgi:hypothetical protein